MKKIKFNQTFLAISNHGAMVGGGEHSFLEFLGNLDNPWIPIAITPEEDELAGRLREIGVKTKIIPLPPLRPWFIVRAFNAIKAHVALCRKRKARLIYANGSRAAFYGGIAGRVSGVPVIFHCRIIDPDPFLDLILGMLCTTIIVNSAATARRFPLNLQSKVKIVYNGIDIDWLQDGSVGKAEEMQGDWKIILVVARISKLKRHDLALSAFEQVAQSDPKLHLVCIGDMDRDDPEWWYELHGRTDASEFSDRIHWMGQEDDVRPFYKVASVLLFPSERESFGRVLVEAMACGVPVVATRSGGVPEIVRNEKEGLLVTPGRADEMADAMKRILEDESFKERASKAAIERSHFFSIEKYVSNMLEIFEVTMGR